MGWQSRAKKAEKEEIERELTKEEKLKIKAERKAKLISIRQEIKKPIDNIDDRVIKSNSNVLFLFFRPALFLIFGISIMLIKKDYSFSANQKLWPIVFTVVNFLTIILLIPLMRMQRISFKNVFKYKERKFKLWQYILIILGLLLSFFIGNTIAEFITYGTFMRKTDLLIQSQYRVLDYFLLIILPLTTVIAEDLFYFGYILNTVKDKFSNYVMIAIFAIIQHGFFPFSFDLAFFGYRLLASSILFGLYTFIYKKTKNLIPIVISHVILNLITMISILLIKA